MKNAVFDWSVTIFTRVKQTELIGAASGQTYLAVYYWWKNIAQNPGKSWIFFGEGTNMAGSLVKPRPAPSISTHCSSEAMTNILPGWKIDI